MDIDEMLDHMPQCRVRMDALGAEATLGRKRHLRALIRGSGCLLYVDHIERAGMDFYRVACQHDVEGIVAKRRDGLYTPEATTWVKIRNPQYSQMEGRSELFT